MDPHLAEKYTFEVRNLEDLETVSSEGDTSINMAILVITATGHPAKEVFARTWCCHTGTSFALIVASTEGLATGVLIST